MPLLGQILTRAGNSTKTVAFSGPHKRLVVNIMNCRPASCIRIALQCPRMTQHAPQSSRCSRWCAALLTSASLVFATTSSHAETWTSLNGSHSIDAKMIGLWGGNVILELGNGRRISVQLDQLRSESRIQAQNMAGELASARGDRVNDLRGKAANAAAPAPDPLPVPEAAPTYYAPLAGQPAADFFAQLDAALEAGHIRAVYDALPPSYRKDIDDVVRSSAQRMDPVAWQNLVGTAHRLGDLIESRQRWFLSSPRVLALPAEQVEVAQGPVLTLAGLLRVGLEPNALQLERLQTVGFGEWIGERDAVIAPYLAQLFEQLGSDPWREITIDSEKDGTAVASIDIDGATTKVTYSNVEGFWVPKSLADNWATSVESWKSGDDASLATALAAAGLVLQPISGELDTLANAKNANDFHAALESAFVPAEAIATSVAALLGKSMNLASNTRGGSAGGYSDYDSGGYEDSMMGMDEEYGDEDYGAEYGEEYGGR